MNISKTNHDILVKEFKDIKQMIESTDILEDKLYYFTAIYGIINRVMNLQSDSTLIFIHQILQNCYLAITQNPNLGNPPKIFKSILCDERKWILYVFKK